MSLSSSGVGSAYHSTSSPSSRSWGASPSEPSSKIPIMKKHLSSISSSWSTSSSSASSSDSKIPIMKHSSLSLSTTSSSSKKPLPFSSTIPPRVSSESRGSSVSSSHSKTSFNSLEQAFLSRIFCYLNLQEGIRWRNVSQKLSNTPFSANCVIHSPRFDDIALSRYAGRNLFISVRSLDISGTAITAVGLHHLLQEEGTVIPQMRCLKLNGVRVNNSVLRLIKPGTSLRELHLMGTLVTDMALEYLHAVPLEILNVQNTTVTNRALRRIPNAIVCENVVVMRPIHALTQMRTAHPSLFLEMTQYLPLNEIMLLRRICMDWNQAIPLYGSRQFGRPYCFTISGARAHGFDDAKLRCWAARVAFSSLQEVDLRGVIITDLGLSYIAKMSHLQSLCISSPLITGEGFHPMSSTALHSIDLSGCTALIDTSLSHFALLSINIFKLNQCTLITEDGLRHLSHMPLVRLELNGCTMIQDITPLLGIKLQYLGLRGCHGINGTLHQLGTVTTLRFLDIYDCTIGEKEAESMRSALGKDCNLIATDADVLAN